MTELEFNELKSGLRLMDWSAVWEKAFTEYNRDNPNKAYKIPSNCRGCFMTVFFWHKKKLGL